MQGPTPVSSLIHSSTMVTAGVFLLIRCSPLIEMSDSALFIITIVGALTAFFAASIAIVQNDIKKVIAYSTMSQLGYMVFACGLSNYNVSLFHLFGHGFFKALLFLSSGVIIHALQDEQDLRKMGGLIEKLPFTYSVMVIGSLALMGLPAMSGFYSKDVILELAYAKYSMDGTFAYTLGIISAGFTSFYSFRLLYLAFINETSIRKGHFSSHSAGHDEAPFVMALPLALLALGSIFTGFIFRDAFIGLGSNFFGNSIFIHPSHVSLNDSEFCLTVGDRIKVLPIILPAASAFLALFLYHFKTLSTIGIIRIALASKEGASETVNINRKGGSYLLTEIYSFLSQRWYMDQVYSY
jgi:NADH-ubiquinone oxidoreductase chain 5